MECPRCGVQLYAAATFFDDELKHHVQQFKCPIDECGYYLNTKSDKQMEEPLIDDRWLYNGSYNRIRFDPVDKIYKCEGIEITVGTGACMYCNKTNQIVLGARPDPDDNCTWLPNTQLCRPCIDRLFRI